jgi:hypothetical protein
MPLLFWIVPYIIAGGVMWFVASQTAPFGREVKLSRAILTVFLMGVCSGAFSYWLLPVIGHWYLLALFVAWVLIVMLTLQQSFWRSLLAVIIYLIVVIGTYAFMELVVHYDGTNIRSR